MKLDLACGSNRQEGYIGVDKVRLANVDRVVDLEKYPWPWKSNSIEEIFCRHYVEQTKDVIAFIDECHRVLKPEGKLIIVSPYYSSIGAWQDPYTVRALTEGTFAHFNAEMRKQFGAEHYEIKSDFDVAYGYTFTPEWQNRSEEARNFALVHYHNVIMDIQFAMTKKKVQEDK